MTETNVKEYAFFGRTFDQIDDGNECQEHGKIEGIQCPTADRNK